MKTKIRHVEHAERMPPQVKIKRLISTTEKYTLEITLDLLRECLALKGVSLPDDANVYVQVPGGGDWSNMTLDVKDHPIQADWKVETREGGIS